MTRFTVTKALPTAKSNEVANFIVEEIILKRGATREMISGRGRSFLTNIVKDIFHLRKSSPSLDGCLHPQTIGLKERFNWILANMLPMYVDVEQRYWDNILPYVTFSYNSAKEDTTGFSLSQYTFFLFFFQTPLDLILPNNT
ncbi:transposon Ty3-I Gag-Pol polyprotein [Nephila pilipes]|uniref:Transposon Ty3-I Gag-Pol polyprotein n=1 Tax=Nephila pilipes TaxID=299642 RepID=A0A8X6PLC0_NEPPI|nr:transposon Ty3-I Gag-Pol polyprotein [Nephila pilipes]